MGSYFCITFSIYNIFYEISNGFDNQNQSSLSLTNVTNLSNIPPKHRNNPMLTTI
jgi:hypothetical protein